MPIGKVNQEFKLYANGWYQGPRDPENYARCAKEVADGGFTAMKIDPFGSNWRSLPKSERDFSLSILRHIRSAVGDNIDLIVEGHSRFDLATAIDLAQVMEPIGIRWFEEPIPYYDWSGYKTLINKSGVPIATGESFWRVDQYLEFFKVCPLSIVQFDPIHVGGIAPSRAIIDIALARNAMIAPHSASGPINEAVCAHLGAAAPHLILLEHFTDSPNNAFPQPKIESSLECNNGIGRVAEKNGLGCTFNVEELERLHSDHDLPDQNLFSKGWEKRVTNEQTMSKNRR